MRISDWSSDVCSTDLKWPESAQNQRCRGRVSAPLATLRRGPAPGAMRLGRSGRAEIGPPALGPLDPGAPALAFALMAAVSSLRGWGEGWGVVCGAGVSARVDLEGGLGMKKKKK